VSNFEVVVWFGFLAPAGTPSAILHKFHADMSKVLAMPDVAEKLKGQGQDVAAMGPEDFGVFLREEVTTWADVVRQANLKFD